MNAKFEKWYIDLLRNPLARAYNNPLNMPSDGDMHRAMEMGWQAAIQSLEVTPDLLKSAIDGFDRLHDLRDEDGKRILKNDECLRRTITAVFNAIKEQAK